MQITYIKEWRTEIESFIRTQTDKHCKGSEAKEILDIGCGVSKDVIKSIYPTTKTLDTHSKHGRPDYFIDLCKENAIQSNLHNFFDIIYCIEVLEHTKYPWIAAENVMKLLKPGGLLFVSVPTSLEYHGELPSYGDYWRFLPDHVECLFRADKKLYLKEFKIENTLVGLSYIIRKNA
jgi:SAM-dependent methyltransferase